MENKLKILIADNSPELGEKCAKILKEYGMDITLCSKDGLMVLNMIKNIFPDVLVADIIMSKIDIIGVLGEIAKMDKKYNPIVMVISGIDNSKLQKEVLDAGASYFFLKPFDINIMAERIMQFCEWKNEETPIIIKEEQITDSELKQVTTNIIHKIGIPAHIKGYHYLREGILISIGMGDIMKHITKQIYPAIAKKFHTTSSRVERAIRHSIGIAWERGDKEVLEEYFGYYSRGADNKPSNSEFIASISDHIRLEHIS